MPERDNLAGLPHVLYRMFDADDVLLYVGISLNFQARMDSHRHEKPWWSDIATIRIEHYPDRPSVERAEVAAIRAENPRYNVAARTDPKPSKRKTRQRTFTVDDELWAKCLRIAKVRRETMASVLRQAVIDYAIGPPDED